MSVENLLIAAQDWRRAEKRHALISLGVINGDLDAAEDEVSRKLHALRIAADAAEKAPDKAGGAR